MSEANIQGASFSSQLEITYWSDSSDPLSDCQLLCVAIIFYLYNPQTATTIKILFILITKEVVIKCLMEIGYIN